MDNFDFYAPTYFAFGKGRESDCGELVKRFGGSKVLLHYGGGSAGESHPSSLLGCSSQHLKSLLSYQYYITARGELQFRSAFFGN